MLSRAFTKPRRSPKNREWSCRSNSLVQDTYDDRIVVGLMEDIPLMFCDHDHHRDRSGSCMKCPAKPTVKDVLRSSVGVMGESLMGMTEKAVLVGGSKIYAVKRFRKISLGKMEFGRRVERVAHVSRRCEYLVPLTAYLYAKRLRFVLFDYYPMGSLSDLLVGGREHGHTALNWKQRLQIIFHVAKAIAFIHSQPPSSFQSKHIQINVHGNVKSSNVMIAVDFSARLSNYGFAQLADRHELSDTWQQKPPPSPESLYCDKLCQKSDVYNFGAIILDILAGPKAMAMKHCVLEKKEEIKDGKFEFFEFSVKGKEKKQALLVLHICLACLNDSPEARPSIDQALYNISEVF